MIDAESVVHEIERLHKFFEDWFNGGHDRTIDEFTDSLDSDFYIVSPRSALSDRARIIETVGSHRGSWPVEIRIENVHIRSEEGALLIATYEEHQNRGSQSAVLISTVGLIRDATRAGGFRWLFVHESWLVPPNED